jgi:beta-xylosidase
MKRATLGFASLILIAALVVGCGPTRTQPPPATPPARPAALFRDDFEGALATGWGWVRQDSTHWNLNDVPGSVRIVLQPGGLNIANNLLLREAPAGNFEIATLVRFTPTSNFQFAGLLIYQDDSNAVQLGRAFCNTPDNCIGNGIYFDNIQYGEFSGSNHGTATAKPAQAYLRLRREGTTYTGYYSENGDSWTVIGQHNSHPSHASARGSDRCSGQRSRNYRRL